MEACEFAEDQVKAVPNKDSHEQRIWLKYRFVQFLTYYSQTVTLFFVPTWQLQDKQSCHIADTSQIQSSTVCAIDQQTSITALAQSKHKGLN